jgi:hypothetical protein
MVDVVPERAAKISATAQPQPLCYLAHLFLDKILALNNKNAQSKRVNMNPNTCLQIFLNFGGSQTTNPMLSNVI